MKNKIKQVASTTILIVFLFAILSIISSYILLKSKFVGGSVDIVFHWSRIYEIRNSITNGNGLFSPVALNKFNESGSAVMTMYPYINLFPIIILSFIIKSFVHLVYFTFILRNFLSLIVAFLACYSFCKNKWTSFIFSISYVLSTMTLFYSFILMDMGVSSSLIFIPLALFGTFKLISDRKWVELSIGMSALIFCHVITAVMVSILVFVIIIVNWRLMINKKSLISLFKFVLTTLLLTSVFWIPFTFLYMHNRISLPNVWWQLSGTDVNTFMGFVFNNSVTLRVNVISVRYITTIAFIGIILGIICYKNMKKFDKQIFWIAIASLFLTSSLFPWNELNDTFIKSTLQFSWRIFIVTQILLCYIFAIGVIQLCKNKKQVFGMTCLIVFAVISMQISGQKEIVDYFAQNKYDIHHIIKDNQGLYTDYFPQESLKISNNVSKHLATISKKKNIPVKLLGNGKFKFKLSKKINSIKMPFIIYDGVDYQVKVDGRNSKFHSDKHAQLTLGHMNKGKHTVQVIVHKSRYNYLSYVLSALGIVILLFSWIKEIVLKLKNK
ncbi:YfhO family protein [Apilactobacillus kunkeei]|nr:YfhO family protein [Apilactobacillus kunkeei]